jgi:hypothetical protein
MYYNAAQQERTTMSQDATISIRINRELKRSLEAYAVADDRSTSSLITKILKRWVAEKPSLPPLALVQDKDDAPEIVHVTPRGRPRVVAHQHEGEHPYRRAVEPWLSGRDRVTVDEVLENALQIDPTTAQIGQRKGVEMVLAELGWELKIERKQGAEDLPVWLLL